MRDILKLGVFLLVVGAIAGLGVGYVNSLTQPVIEKRSEEARLAGFEEVLPAAEEIKNETEEYPEKNQIIKEINVAYKNGSRIGVIYTVAPSGYSGAIRTMVGFDIEEKVITGIKILEHSETPGLGAKCTEPSFVEKFSDKSADKPLTVVKQEPADKNEIEAITASTITSEAVVKGVNAAREHFEEHFVEN